MSFLKEIPHTVPEKQLDEIDYIYLINLDHRTQKLKTSLIQLDYYHLVPERVSAVYGKDLTVEDLDQVGLNYQPEMDGVGTARHYYEDNQFEDLQLPLKDSDLTLFSQWTNKAVIGCALSHLSVLRDAYKHGYKTIWVLEDDFQILKDPHILSKYIQELDKITGNDWDLLYTDKDEWGEKDLNSNLEWQWRPDISKLDPSQCYKRKILNDHFLQIGLRIRTHSLIFSRSGIEKVLRYYDDYGIFLPIDHELGLIPNFKMFNLRKSVVSFFQFSKSDIQGG